ncbi:hypothetical protein Rsub_00468 [Raphidocelis subcapitata]|uniref:Uncharacterized protein n=1 Tax=Raphidocelis subcapitata TaxID=307507 RepID=A0A2V0NS45_9CHLO|nr:hypothetical protein Rsub_00468 [Raphidocelis subcapitata]|eukprot:GBF87757.1 hypothetical protein Rsub_00468 [Raphidocelis subcapitata]
MDLPLPTEGAGGPEQGQAAGPLAATPSGVPQRWQLAMAVHTMEVATAKVPFSMILLMDHVRTKRALPDDLRCRLVIPTDGLISVSLWDVADPDALKAWLDENLGSDCINQVSEVQEEFTFGVALELARQRGADRVAGGGRKTLDALSAGISTAQSKIQEWDRQTGVLSTARETTASTVAKISGAVSKAAESDRVQSVVAGASAAAAQGWRRVSDWATRLGEVAKDGGAAPHRSGGEAGAPPEYAAAVGGGGGGYGAPAAADDLDRRLRLEEDPLEGLDGLGLGGGAGTSAGKPPGAQP